MDHGNKSKQKTQGYKIKEDADLLNHDQYMKTSCSDKHKDKDFRPNKHEDSMPPYSRSVNETGSNKHKDKDSGSDKHKDSGPDRHKDFGPNKYKDSGSNKHKDSGPNKHKDSGPDRHKDSGPNKYKDSGSNKHKDSMLPYSRSVNETRSDKHKDKDSGSDKHKDFGPDRHKDSGPDRHKDSGPDKHKDSGPDKHKDSGPDRHKDSGPDRHKDSGPNKHKDSMPSYSRSVNETRSDKHKDSGPDKHKDSGPDKPYQKVSKDGDISDDSDISYKDSDKDGDISDKDGDISDKDSDISYKDSDKDGDISDKDCDINDKDGDISDKDDDISGKGGGKGGDKGGDKGDIHNKGKDGNIHDKGTKLEGLGLGLTNKQDKADDFCEGDEEAAHTEHKKIDNDLNKKKNFPIIIHMIPIDDSSDSDSSTKNSSEKDGSLSTCKTKQKELDNDDEIDNTEKNKNAKISLNDTELFQKCLQQLPLNKRELASNHTKRKAYYFGDSVCEVENRVNTHNPLDLFAVTAEIDPSSQFHRKSVFARDKFPFPCRNSKKADCTRVMCAKCKMHMYLYHKRERIYQLPCRHYMCSECIHIYFEACYNKHKMWDPTLKKLSEEYIANMLEQKKMDKQAAFALPKLISAKCIAESDDKANCDMFICCPCNNKICKQISEFVNHKNNKLTKFPKRLHGFSDRALSIFSQYVQHYNYWRMYKRSLMLDIATSKDERQSKYCDPEQGNEHKDKDKKNSVETAKDCYYKMPSKETKLQQDLKKKKRNLFVMENDNSEHSSSSSTPATKKQKKSYSTIQAFMTLHNEMADGLKQIKEVQHIQYLQTQQLQQSAVDLVNFMEKLLGAYMTSQTKLQIIKKVNVETNYINTVSNVVAKN